MGRFSRLGNALYEGRRSIDFVGRRWLWYSISGVVIVAAIIGLSTRGLNLGIEFKGGSEFTVSLPSNQVTSANVSKIAQAVNGTGIKEAAAPTVTTSGKNAILVTTETMSQDQSDKVTAAIADTMHISATKDVNEDAIGPSWGSQVANRALTGLIVFLVLVVIFIWAYFREWKMSVAALVALAHDLVITTGIYALSGFQVTPATVTGLLTILGFSLYDTVVVFDKIRENTKNLRRSRKSYAELANLAVNQTLVRSINTSFVALLPVAALLFVSVRSLGSGDLRDLSLALFIGMLTGAYSSIFVATPVLVQMKQRERVISQQDARAKARARRDVDRYADVPSFTEDMPVAAEPTGLGGAAIDVRESEDDEPEEPTVRPATRRPEASGSGRVVPTTKAPVEQSGSAKRNQPSRQPRSKRGR